MILSVTSVGISSFMKNSNVTKEITKKITKEIKEIMKENPAISAIKTEENIVFSHKQYMKSINAKENQDFLHNLQSDFTTSNMLFIGCSLINEPDLKYVYSIAEHSSDTLRVLLRDKK